jgi:hypothetical protein
LDIRAPGIVAISGTFKLHVQSQQRLEQPALVAGGTPLFVSVIGCMHFDCELLLALAHAHFTHHAGVRAVQSVRHPQYRAETAHQRLVHGRQRGKVLMPLAGFAPPVIAADQREHLAVAVAPVGQVRVTHDRRAVLMVLAILHHDADVMQHAC